MKYARYKPSKNGRRKAKPSEKKVTAAEVKTIAKKVHYKNTETKWRGIETITNRQPNSGSSASTFLFVRALGLEKGDNNQTRDGRKVRSMSIQSSIHMTNTMLLPIYLRVLCLRHKDPSVDPTVSNVLLDIETKTAVALTQAQRDMTSKVNLDLWTVLLDKVHHMFPRAVTGGTTISGQSRWTYIYKCYKKLNSATTYELAEVNVTDQPIKDPISWVYILAFSDGIVPPAVPTGGEAITITLQNYHYFKDL